MKSHWRTNLGGALSIVGKSLVGIGVLPQLSGAPSRLLLYIAVAGFVLEGLGSGVTALFAADAKQVKLIAEQVETNAAAIETKVDKV